MQLPPRHQARNAGACNRRTGAEGFGRARPLGAGRVAAGLAAGREMCIRVPATGLMTDRIFMRALLLCLAAALGLPLSLPAAAQEATQSSPFSDADKAALHAEDPRLPAARTPRS